MILDTFPYTDGMFPVAMIHDAMAYCIHDIHHNATNPCELIVDASDAGDAGDASDLVLKLNK